MTAARFTQTGNEVWYAAVSRVRFTQTGNEVWLSAVSRARFTQTGVEVWRSVADYVQPPSGGHKAAKWRRAKQHPAFGAAAKRRRLEVISIAPVLQPTVAPSRKGAHAVAFRAKRVRYQRTLRRHAVMLLDAAVLGAGGVGKSVHHARFFARKPARRPRDMRRHAAVLLAPVLAIISDKAARHARFFARKPARRAHDIRRHAALVSVAQVTGTTFHKGVKLRDFFGRPRWRYVKNRRHQYGVTTSQGATFVCVIT